jgi:polyphosphate kinase
MDEHIETETTEESLDQINGTVLNGHTNGSPEAAQEHVSEPLDETPEPDLPPDLNDPRYYINRELSLLAFQFRVLEEAQDPSNPLLERVKFLSIVGSNLDEFFMVRVGGLKMQMETGVTEFSIDGLAPAEQLAEIRQVASELLLECRRLWNDDLLPGLDEAGIHLLAYDQMNEKQQSNMTSYFENVIFPVLTPLAFDPGRPFPHISNLSLNLAVLIRDQFGEERFARVKVPTSLPRLVPVKRSSGGVRKDGTVPHHHFFIWLEELIAIHLPYLFPGMEVVEWYPFRVTRNADFELQELEADDLLETMQERLRGRQFGSVVRLSVSKAMPRRIREILINNLEMEPNDVYTLEEPLGTSSLMILHEIDRHDLIYPPFLPALPNPLKSEFGDVDLFSFMRRDNLLLHHPYDSFAPVVDFLEAASRDPDVMALKQTLYRVGTNSPVVQTLLNARRQHGKQVAVLLELKARFDEKSNIGWAQMLEREGVHVIYGLLGLKTHAKIALIVRREGTGIRRYLHLGTGNYNHVTAQHYEDFGYFTADEDMGADATDLFNYLTGYSAKEHYRKLLVAPINMRARILELIENEIERHQEHDDGHIIFKLNSLTDKMIIHKLYEASQAGVSIDLIVRGLCSLRPGVEHVSENIKVVSIIGRFLEHSRIYFFNNGGVERLYMGSADMMPRNLDRRVEVLFPIESEEHVAYIRDEILKTYLTDNKNVRYMDSDGNYTRVTFPDSQDEPVDTQSWFLQRRTTIPTRS